MIAIPLGRINVPTAGTDVPITLTADQLSKLPPNACVTRVDVWPDVSNAGTALLVRRGGVTLAQLPKTGTTGYAEPWNTPECCGNRIDPTAFALGAATNGDGGFVTLWVE